MKEKRKKAQGVHGNEKVAERVKRRKKTKDLGVVVGINPKKKEKTEQKMAFLQRGMFLTYRLLLLML